MLSRWELGLHHILGVRRTQTARGREKGHLFKAVTSPRQDNGVHVDGHALLTHRCPRNGIRGASLVIPAKLGTRRPRKRGPTSAAPKGADGQGASAQQPWSRALKHPGAEGFARATLQRGGGHTSRAGVDEGQVPTAASHVPVQRPVRVDSTGRVTRAGLDPTGPDLRDGAPSPPGASQTPPSARGRGALRRSFPRAFLHTPLPPPLVLVQSSALCRTLLW